MGMVKGGYRQLDRPRKFKFLRPGNGPGRPPAGSGCSIQGPDGDLVTALYEMVEIDGRWRIKAARWSGARIRETGWLGEGQDQGTPGSPQDRPGQTTNSASGQHTAICTTPCASGTCASLLVYGLAAIATNARASHQLRFPAIPRAAAS